ncbi:MAG: hypothetical protein ACRDN0_25265 [Trebonia sp.]
MRDIANMIMNGLRDAASPASASPADDDRWSGRARRRRPAGDWCQTDPGEDVISQLAAELRAMSGRGRRRPNR